MPAMEPPILDQVDEQLKAVIHHLYALMIQSYDYAGPQTASAMTNEIKLLIQNLTSFARTSRDLPIDVPSDIVQYVENGRNPDIYNREFVESAQQLNQQLKGRTEAYVQFRDALAKEMKTSMPEIAAEVDKVVGAINTSSQT